MDRTHALIQTKDGLLAARESGLYRVTAGGAQENLYRVWRRDGALPTMAAAYDQSSGTLLAGIQGGVARSGDGGETWEALPFRAPPPLVTCLALSSDFADDGCALAGTFEDGVFRSSDGGRRWLAVNHGLFDHAIFCLAVSPGFTGDGLVFAGTSSGIYRSDNGGRLWRDLVMPAGDETVLSLALSPDFARDNRIYAGCETHGLLRSNDGGESWERILADDGAVNAVAAGADKVLVAQLDDAALVSRDGGVAWREMAADVDCLTLDADGRALWLALAGGSFRRVEL